MTVQIVDEDAICHFAPLETTSLRLPTMQASMLCMSRTKQHPTASPSAAKLLCRNHGGIGFVLNPFRG